MNKIYLGVSGNTREIFKSPSIPTEISHPQYRYCIGAFRTMRGAIFMRDYGRGNPHCQTVGESEILGKRYQGDKV